MTEAGKISVVFSAMTAKYFSDIRKAKTETGNLAKRTERDTERMAQAYRRVGMALTGVGVAILGIMARQARSFMKVGDELQKMSLRTGFAVRELDRLNFMANRSGTSLQAVETGIRRMNRALFTAGTVSAETAATIERLGFSMDEIRAMKPEQAFQEIMKALAGVSHEGERAAIAQELFGRSGTALLPIIAEGEEAYKKLAAEAEKNSFWTEENAKLAVDLQDAMYNLHRAVGNLALAFIAPLIPSLTALAERAKKLIDVFREWQKENPELAATVTRVTAAVGGLFVVLGMLAMAKSALMKIGIISFFKKLAFVLLHPIASLKILGAMILGIGKKIVLGIIAPVLKALIPLGLIGLAAYAVWNRWDEMKEGFGIIWDWVVDKIMWAWSKIEPVAKWIGEAFMSRLEWVYDGFKWMVDGIVRYINALIRGMNRIPKVNIPEIPMPAWEKIERPVKEFTTGILMKETWEPLVTDPFGEMKRGFEMMGLGPEGLIGKEAIATFAGLSDDLLYLANILRLKLDNFSRGFRDDIRDDSGRDDSGWITHVGTGQDMSPDARRIFGMGEEEVMGAGRASAITPEMLAEFIRVVSARPQVVEAKIEVNNPMGAGEEERLLRKFIDRVKELFAVEAYMGGG